MTSSGTYKCSYTLPAVQGSCIHEKQLEVLLNGENIRGSPFVIKARPVCLDWFFQSLPKSGGYELQSDRGSAVKRKKTETWQGVVAGFDRQHGGMDSTAMVKGVHYWELTVANKNVVQPASTAAAVTAAATTSAAESNGGARADVMFGVCRPGVDLENFHETGGNAWMMWQHDGNGGGASKRTTAPYWSLRCKSCAGAGMVVEPAPNLVKPGADEASIGLLLDLDNGGTLTMYMGGMPCGTIAEGLVGPLLPCVASYYQGQVISIKGGYAPEVAAETKKRLLTAETAF